jgi:glycosyltransferase involved in cell wall biosynthesis
VKILHITDHYLPVLGGIETHVAALTDRQARRGDDVTVLTWTPATADGRRSADDGAVSVRRVRSILQGLRVDFASYDVVHAHVSVVAPFTSPVTALCARSGVPTVVTVHSLWNGTGPVPATAAALTGLRTAPVLWTAVSRLAAQDLRDRLPPGSAVRILPNAVDVPARKRTPTVRPDGTVRLISTMRIARRKRPLPLLRMYEALTDSVDVPLQLSIIGDGPVRPRLERRLRRTSVATEVRLTGRIDAPGVAEALAGADIYVAPAVLESFGLAALEARCVGLPVVGHARSGMTDFVHHGVEGLLCADDDDMVERLRDLVVDHDLRHRIAEHNRLCASGMTWANTMADHDAAYAVVRASAPARRRAPQAPLDRAMTP